jgi:hypothetical protein
MLRPVVAESSGSPPSPKAAFGNARLFARTAAYGFRCELTLSATTGHSDFSAKADAPLRRPAMSGHLTAAHKIGLLLRPGVVRRVVLE